MTSVVVADDQDLIRSGLRLVLEARGCDVVGEAADGREASSDPATARASDRRCPRLAGTEHREL